MYAKGGKRQPPIRCASNGARTEGVLLMLPEWLRRLLSQIDPEFEPDRRMACGRRCSHGGMCALRICHNGAHKTLSGHEYTDDEALTAEQADQVIRDTDPMLFAFIQSMRRIEAMREGD